EEFISSAKLKSEAFPQVKRSGAEPLGDLKGHLCPSSQRGIHFLCEVKNKRKPSHKQMLFAPRCVCE
ncbi:hypothetical protein B6S12_04970, partial [Helicobacter valdiviensis]